MFDNFPLGFGLLVKWRRAKADVLTATAQASVRPAVSAQLRQDCARAKAEAWRGSGVVELRKVLEISL